MTSSQKISAGWQNNYLTGCMYPFFKNHCKIMAINFSEQTLLDIDQ